MCYLCSRTPVTYVPGLYTQRERGRKRLPPHKGVPRSREGRGNKQKSPHLRAFPKKQKQKKLLFGNFFQLGGTYNIAIEPCFLGSTAIGHRHQLGIVDHRNIKLGTVGLVDRTLIDLNV